MLVRVESSRLNFIQLLPHITENHHKAIRAGDPSLLNCPPELGFYGVVAVDLANESYKRKKYMKWAPERKRVGCPIVKPLASRSINTEPIPSTPGP